MPNIIEWGNWNTAQEVIQATNKAVSGLSPSQAEAALKFQKVTLQDGTIRYVMNTANQSVPGAQIDFNTGAVDASWEYVQGGGQVSQTGAAITGPSAVKSNNLAMTQNAGGLASVGALLSVNLPTAAAAIAPIAGVALGAGLYSLSPDLWDKISRALLPFCYEGTELLPVVADENGVTYFSKDAIDAVKNELSNIVDSGIVTDTTSNIAKQMQSYDTIPFPFSYYISSYFKTGGSFYEEYSVESPLPMIYYNHNGHNASSGYASFVSKTPFKYNQRVVRPGTDETTTIDAEEFTVNNKKLYCSQMYSYGRIVDYDYCFTCETHYNPLNLAAYLVLYGGEDSYPVGVSQWNGVQYPINQEGIGVVTRISEDGQIVTTNPYYPVTMPVGDPGVSPRPNEVPAPGENTEIAPAVDPWLTPKPGPGTYPEGQPESDPAKVPDPVPDTDPNLDPNANPSQAPEAQPQPDPDPAQSTKPNDSGVSPDPQIPIISILPSAATGLLHVYNPTQSQIDAFGSWLWTTFSGDLIDTISKLFNDPMDAVIGLHELYATPSVSGSSTIRAGFLDSGVSSNLVGSRYTTINCGSIVVQEHYQNYLDYSPYTKCYIYLPFVGIVPVLADDIIGNAVNVTYHVDSYTGCCIAVVTVAREGYSSTVYQFEGNCAVEIPITSGYQSTLMGALIGAGATALTGNPHAGIAAANMGRASLGKNDVSHSGSFGSSYGAMGAKTPYIIVKRPTQKSVVNYNQDYGFPAHKRVTIGSCSGYLRAREVHVISPTATDEEKARIEELLKTGVFVQ